jgi:hypothetical protein
LLSVKGKEPLLEKARIHPNGNGGKDNMKGRRKPELESGKEFRQIVHGYFLF